jgi:hypothetical protein
MAKKRREKDDEEELDFKIPKFDEEKFLKKERKKIKTNYLSFLLGFIIGLISFGFWILLSGNQLRWELVLLFCVFNGSWLRYIFTRFNIDLTDFERRNWFTSYAIYFFTWFLVLLVLVNPPFYDDEPPAIEIVALPDAQEIGGSVKIVARIRDNVNVEKDEIVFNLEYPDGSNLSPEFSYDGNIFLYVYDNPDNIVGEYRYTISAKDVNNIKSEIIEDYFIYSEDTIKVASPANSETIPGPVVTYAEPIRFDVQAEVSRVYYKVDDSVQINATLVGDYYETTPKKIGWTRGKNANVTAFAEVIFYFDNFQKQFNNTIIDNTTYHFQVTDDSQTGTEPSPEIKIKGPGVFMVPGFELLIFIISMIFVVFIFKKSKSKKNKNN